VDIFESLARKGWSGGGLDELLEKGQDLFAVEADIAAHFGGNSSSADTAKLFSILPPKSILADSSSDVSRKGGHTKSDSLLVDMERYQSLSALAATAGEQRALVADTDSVFSADFNKPRNARPFSPQPIRPIPTDVTFDSLRDMAEDIEAPKKRPLEDDDDDDEDGDGDQRDEEPWGRDDEELRGQGHDFGADDTSPEARWSS
jgi:hypothetical protein